MSKTLLRHIQVVDPGGPAHGTEVDLLVEDGRFIRIGQRLPKGTAREINLPGLHASPGWLDLQAHFRDPGEEYKQGILNGLDAAAVGGFTSVAVLPSTQPVIDTRSGIEHLLRKGAGHAVRVLPIGALTKGLQGHQLAELFDLEQAGAVAFSDDQHAIRNARLLMLALQYSIPLKGVVMVFPQDADLAHSGQMHESPMSARLGLRGIPALAEEVQLARDIALLAYTGSRMHVSTVSTAEGVALVRKAKLDGLAITAAVAAHHLLLDDGCLRGFDPLYKVLPPLRDPEHIEALREGVKDGTIDSIVSDHRPEDVEHKKVEFAQAAFGAIGLETSFAVANTALKGRLSLRRLVERFSHGPRKVLGLPVYHIAEGGPVDITLFDPEVQWTCTKEDLVSRSKNSPFIGQPLTGRPLGILRDAHRVLSPALKEQLA